MTFLYKLVQESFMARYIFLKIFRDKIIFSSDPYEALEGSDAMALMTEWAEFRIPDLSRMASLMKNRVIFDGRNIYDPAEIKKAGFEYFGIGRR